MKIKFILVSLALTGLVTNSFAQQVITPSATSDNRDQFGFGIKGGVNFSNVYDEEGDDFVADGRTGFFAGAFVSVPFNTLFGLQPEINYSQKGFKSSASFLGETYTFERTTGYLDIPLQLQIKPSQYFTFLIGPQFSYLLNTKNDYNGDLIFEGEQKVNEDNYRKNILGFVVGAEANYKGLLFMVRGGFDVTKTDEEGNSTSPRYKNQVVQLGLGYTFY